MGGIAISMAAEARPAKVSKLVYLAAFLLQNGQSMFDLACADTASMILPALRVDPSHNIIDLDRSYIRDIFYGESTAQYTILSGKLLRPEPLWPIVTPVSITQSFNSVRRFYIETSYDRAVTPGMQKRMYTAMPCEEVFTLHSEHSPFFSMPENLKNTLLKIAKDSNASKTSEVSPLFVKEEEYSSILAYPNPTSGTITVPNTDVNTSVSILNMNGNLLGTFKPESGDLSIDMHAFPAGNYVLRIEKENYTVSGIITIVH
jgi:hypothetical protein